MADFVIEAPDAATFAAAAQAMGFADTQGTIITQGRIPGNPDPMASYFFNLVGVVEQPTGAMTTDGQGNTVPVMAAIAGHWSRLRINGDNPFTRGLIAVPSSLTVYALVTPADGSAAFWSADGVTPAPAYVATIGVIA